MSVDYPRIAAAALTAFDRVMAALGLTGKRQGHEFLPLNPRRADSSPGSFSINTVTGQWADFASGDQGGDLISLAAYVRSASNAEAARWLAETLGLPDAHTTPKAPPIQKADPGGEFVAPVPNDAPPPPVGHYKHGKPTGLWAYHAADGGLLFLHARFDPRDSRKQFAPITLWRESGRLIWRWKWPPAPTPLYNLPSLAACPDGPVILTEGEKACDAAARLLPGRACLTWAGGTGSVGKADLAPLAGREVWIWPDFDEPGEACARKLVVLLRAAGVETIHRFNPALFRHAPRVDAQGNATLADGLPLEVGDDAADLLADGWQAAHLALWLALPGSLTLCATVETPKPAAQLTTQGRFEMRPDGLFRNRPDGGAQFVCPAFNVLARCRDPESHAWGLLIALEDPDGRKHRIVVPYRVLRGDGATALEMLFDRGLLSRRGMDGYLIEYLRDANPSGRARIAAKTGWHRGIFVLPQRAYGARSGEQWIYEPEGGQPGRDIFSIKGDLADWNREVGALTAGNTRLVFACALAFAAPLLEPLGFESGGFNLVGHSGSGKTTALRVGASVCGGPDYIERLRATDNGLEGIFVARSDAPAFLDEMGQLQPAVAGAAVYMAANGAAKVRANRTGGTRDRITWRTLFLCAGEVDLAGHMSEAGSSPKAGQQIRLVDLQSDAGKGLGLFDTIHGFANAHEFAQHLGRTCGTFHGTAFDAFLRKLQEVMQAKGDDLVVALRNRIRLFEARVCTASAGGQALRVAARLGLISAAGELARVWLGLPWQEDEATNACEALFNDWLVRRGGEGDLEDRQMLDQVRDFLSRHGEGRFTDWDRCAADSDTHAPRVLNRAGFRRVTQDSEERAIQHSTTDGMKMAEHFETEYFIFPNIWKTEVCKGFDPSRVAKLLIKRAALEPAPDGRPAKLVKLPGERRQRVYHITPNAFQGE